MSLGIIEIAGEPAQGTTSGSTFAATALTDNGKPPQRPGGPHGGSPPGNNANSGTFVAGTVKQISGTTLTLSTRDGKTITLATDGNTKVTAHHQGAFTNLKVGDQVDAMADPKSGTANNATAFTAARVSDHSAH